MSGTNVYAWGTAVSSIIMAIYVDRVKEQTLHPLFKRVIMKAQRYANFYPMTHVQRVTDAETRSMTDFSANPHDVETDPHDVEVVGDDRSVPVGWAHLINTENYVRIIDGISMGLTDAMALEALPTVKQEHHISLPAIVKFYKDRVEYCTQKQFVDLQTIVNRMNDDGGDVDGAGDYDLQSSVMFVSLTTKPVHVNLAFIGERNGEVNTRALIATTSDVNGCNIDEYKLNDAPDQFPTFEDIIRYIPGLYQQMKAWRDKVNRGVLSSCNNTTMVAIQDSILSVDMRRAIIELDSEESELNTKLEELHKRKRELEEAGRNVRKCNTKSQDSQDG